MRMLPEFCSLARWVFLKVMWEWERVERSHVVVELLSGEVIGGGNVSIVGEAPLCIAESSDGAQVEEKRSAPTVFKKGAASRVAGLGQIEESDDELVDTDDKDVVSFVFIRQGVTQDMIWIFSTTDMVDT